MSPKKLPAVAILVKGVKTSHNGRLAQDTILTFAGRESRVSIVCYYYATNNVHVESSRVTEGEWLKHNSNEPYLAVVNFSSLGNVRQHTIRNIATAIVDFEAQTSAIHFNPRDSFHSITPSSPMPEVDEILMRRPACTRMIRYMDANFYGRRPRMAILVPVTLRGVTRGVDSPLRKVFLPSLVNNNSADHMQIGVYFGVDDDEVLPLRFIPDVAMSIDKMTNISFEGAVLLPASHRRTKNVAVAYNRMFQQAMMDGYDFAIQLQDDCRIESPSWGRRICGLLCTSPLALGAYSLCERFDKNRMNNVCVSRTHYDLFGFMFNPRCLDPSEWARNVMGKYCHINKTIRCTNTLRLVRRKRNMTAHVYRYYDHDDAAVSSEDRKLFQRLIASTI